MSRTRKRKLEVAAIVLGTVAALTVARAVFPLIANTREPTAEPLAASSALAFQESYLNLANRQVTSERVGCSVCHPSREGLSQDAWNRVEQRAPMDRASWAAAAHLSERCGSCHLLPDPGTLTWTSWADVFTRMAEVMDFKHVPKLTAEETSDLLHFYYTFGRLTQRPLDADPDPARSAVRFESVPLQEVHLDSANVRPGIGQVEVVDLRGEGKPGVLACNTEGSAVEWIHSTGTGWQTDVLASLPFPARAHLIPSSARSSSDIVVACLGTMQPSDELKGSVVLLVAEANGAFRPVQLLEKMCRVSDVKPCDLDGDGDLDFLVAAYGYIQEGEVGWLERRAANTYEYRRLVQRPGALQIVPVDLNGDGRVDFVVPFAQEHEQISAFINHGTGVFEETILFKAATPSYGLSGIQVVDLDQDNDVDVVFTNGDNMDLPNVLPRAFHGVQWLENKGELQFRWQDILRFYGAYSAVVGDIDGDGKLDLTVASLFNDWRDPKRASLIWLQNDGHQHFRPQGIARQPIHLISAALGDLDNDGRLDIVASSLNGFPPFERLGRVTLWRNLRH